MDHSNRIGFTLLIFPGLAVVGIFGCSKKNARESANSAFQSDSDQSLSSLQKPPSHGFYLQGSQSPGTTPPGSSTTPPAGATTPPGSSTTPPAGATTPPGSSTTPPAGAGAKEPPPVDSSLNPDPSTPSGTSTPLVIDLDGDDWISTAYKTHHKLVFFDINGIGKRELIPWISPKDGFLVYDHNFNGKVDSGQELFGNGTLINSVEVKKRGPSTSTSTSFANGFEALSIYDSDHNGKIDEMDPVFSGLQIWQDFNLDGITDRGELSSLGHWGIKSIALTYTNLVPASSILDDSGTFIGQKSVVMTNSGSRGIFDVYFRLAPKHQISRNHK